MKDKDETTAAPRGSDTSRLTPLDVQQKEFRVSFRGYNERDVDEFLDLVTEELQRYERELMRVRSERVALDSSSLDLDSEAQRMLADARERADTIVREAEARAAGVPTATAADARAVVAPYLNRERQFLERLGSLVQEHAQSIRTMVEEARRRTEFGVAGPIAASPAAPVSPGAFGGGVGSPTSPAKTDDRPDVDAADAAVGASTRESADAGDDSVSDVFVLDADQPVPSRAEQRGGDGETEGARSLRELFWGED
jgi:cell division initiation protein